MTVHKYFMLYAEALIRLHDLLAELSFNWQRSRLKKSISTSKYGPKSLLNLVSLVQQISGLIPNSTRYSLPILRIHILMLLLTKLNKHTTDIIQLHSLFVKLEVNGYTCSNFWSFYRKTIEFFPF